MISSASASSMALRISVIFSVTSRPSLVSNMCRSICMMLLSGMAVVSGFPITVFNVWRLKNVHRTRAMPASASQRRTKPKVRKNSDVISDSSINAIRKFVAERDWSQFHTPGNLAKSISIEAAELL